MPDNTESDDERGERPGGSGNAAPGKRRGRPPGSRNRSTIDREARTGRVERALSRELRDSELPDAAKLHLRATAHLLDVAEAAADIDAGAKITRALLELRQAYGLAGSRAEALDPFAAFVAGMGVAERPE